VSTRRPTDCPASNAPAGTENAPRRLISRQNVSDFYPAEAVNYAVEGRVVVILRYDTTGCVVETAISQSSGSEALDRAALAFGFGVVLQPAIVNGKPMAEAVLQPVIFSIQEWPAAPAAVAQPQP
jgi:TonB family protein